MYSLSTDVKVIHMNVLQIKFFTLEFVLAFP